MVFFSAFKSKFNFKFNLYNKLLTLLGKIKIFKYPMFLLYQPYGYKVTGPEIRKLTEEIKPGDILIRGYYNYLDGYLIPGKFSHAGFYYGDNTVIHAVAEGVGEEDIIDFCECDYIAILRIKENGVTEKDIEEAKRKAKLLKGCPYDFLFKAGNKRYYCSELVLQIWDHKAELLNIRPMGVKYLLGLLKRKVILPDQLYKCRALDIIFTSKEVCKDKPKFFN